MLALHRPNYAQLFMRMDARVGRVNASQVSEDMLQLQNPMKVSMERPNNGGRQRVNMNNNNESRDSRSSRSYTDGGARTFRGSRDEGGSNNSRTMSRDRPQQPRNFDRRDRDERGSFRPAARGSSAEPALILNNPKKVSFKLCYTTYNNPK
jgi:hypothetical protein